MNIILKQNDGGATNDSACYHKAIQRPILLLAFAGLLVLESAAATLEVDQRGDASYRTIAEAVAAAQAGDTIQLAAGSGPYREAVLFQKSGEPGKPITFDGQGELVTGFEPLTGFRKEGNRILCDLPIIPTRLNRNPDSPFPCVIIYHGERLVVDPSTGQFTKHARMSEDRKSLELLPESKPEGWEIATRDIVIGVLKASHLVIRNVRASGGTNDGFNVHSTCQDVIFENIEGFHNFDEGFSAHDVSETEIRKGRFWGNDNGIWNMSRPTIKFRATDVDIYSNLGWGLWLRNGEYTLSNIKVWDNGVGQIHLGGKVKLDKVTAYESRWGVNRPWETYQETKTVKPKSKAVTIDADCAMEGEQPSTLSTGELPSLLHP